MLTVYCRGCKASIESSDVFCKACGADQRPPSQQPTPVVDPPVQDALPPPGTTIPVSSTLKRVAIAVLCLIVVGGAGLLLYRPASSGHRPGSFSPSDLIPRPFVQMQGRSHIGNAHISLENDGNGHEEAAGRVLIVNDGPYAITDFQLGLKVLGSEYALVPFEGSLRYPIPISNRRIEPGGTLEVPVMTTGVYTSFSVYGSKQITLEASIDGPPGVVTDETTLD